MYNQNDRKFCAGNIGAFFTSFFPWIYLKCWQLTTHISDAAVTPTPRTMSLNPAGIFCDDTQLLIIFRNTEDYWLHLGQLFKQNNCRDVVSLVFLLNNQESWCSIAVSFLMTDDSLISYVSFTSSDDSFWLVVQLDTGFVRNCPGALSETRNR